MRLFAARRPITADTPLDGVLEIRPRWVGDLSPAEIRASIERALRILEVRREAGGHNIHELQAVVQVCPAGEQYPRWRKDRNRLMQRSSKRWGTGSWPEQLRPDEVGVVLLPYPAGRVGPALAARSSSPSPSSSSAARRLVRPSSCSRCRSSGCGCT